MRCSPQLRPLRRCFSNDPEISILMLMRGLGRRFGLAWSAACVTGAVCCACAPASVDQSGYITVADGTQLRYTVTLPSAAGRFPVAMNYDGYCAGTGALGCNDPELSQALLDHGYALFG